MVETCTFKPFVSQVVPPSADLNALASGMQLLVGQLENYFRDLLAVICQDLQDTGSAETFLELSDTPATYAGAANNFVRVNAGETGLTFFAATLVTTFLQLSDTPASYAGASLQALRVNVGETAVEFFTQTFLLLSDTPSSYAGFAGSLVSVNAAATGLEFSGAAGVSLATIITTLTRGFFLSGVSAATSWGIAYNLIAGAQAVAQPTTTSLATSFARVTDTTAAGAGSSSGIRPSSNSFFLGNTTAQGGCRMRVRFATTTALAQQRLFIGFSVFGGADFTNGNPSAKVNLFGISYDSAATVLSFINNDNAGTATSTPLGANFPVDATSVYDVEISAQPNSTVVNWTVTNVGTGSVASGSVNSDLPAVNTNFMPYLWINNGTTASQAVLCLIHVVVGLFGG